MANDRFKWVLSPSKVEASKGCPCFEDDPDAGEEHKERGTLMHGCMEKDDAPVDDLSDNDLEQIEFCKNFRRELLTKLEGEGALILQNIRELRIQPTDKYPRGTADWVVLAAFPNRQYRLYVVDWKFGVMPVPDVYENEQIKAYLYMVWKELEAQGAIKDDNYELRFFGAIVQPQLDVDEVSEFTAEDLEKVPEGLKTANDRVTDPFKKPDPSDPDKCARCAYTHRCPAIKPAVMEFYQRALNLPLPENFEPDALVSVRDRVIAQDLATILTSWAVKVKRSNKEFAASNGGTLGGVYNVSEQGRGYKVTDPVGFADSLVDAGLLETREEMLKHVRVSKGKAIEGILENQPTRMKVEVEELVDEAMRRNGEPNPKVQVMRRGGKKAIKAGEDLGIPMLLNPWKE